MSKSTRNAEDKKKIEFFIKQLQKTRQLAMKVHQRLLVNAEVSEAHPEILSDTERWLNLAETAVSMVRREIEIQNAHILEISDALPALIVLLADLLMIAQNKDFLDATDKNNLSRIIKNVLQYSPQIFADVMAELSEQEKQDLLGKQAGRYPVED